MATEDKIKSRFLVRIVDDDPGVLTGLQFLLTCLGWKSVGYSSAAEFLEKDNRDIAGVVLLDIRMPGMSGLTLQQKLIEEACKLQIVIITGHADVDTAVRTLKRGAFDFLTKPVTSEKLEAVLDECARKYLAKESGLSARELIEIFNELSAREKDILNLVVKGLTSRQIAERLGLSERTVQGHRLNLSKKFNVHSKSELLACLGVIEKALSPGN